MSARWKILLGILCVVGALLLLETAPYVWDGWRPASCWPACSCEPLRHAWVRTPLNAYTNLVYVLVAGWMGHALARWDAQRRGYAALFAAATLVLGLGSFFFHASLTFAGQWFDVMGMYWLVSFMALYAAVRQWNLNGKTFAVAYIALTALLGVLLIVAPALRRTIFMLELVVALLLEIVYLVRCRPAIRWEYLVAGLAVFFASDRLRAWDMASWACRPESWLQLHPLYHIISALAIALLYLYYASESNTPGYVSLSGKKEGAHL